MSEPCFDSYIVLGGVYIYARGAALVVRISSTMQSRHEEHIVALLQDIRVLALQFPVRFVDQDKDARSTFAPRPMVGCLDNRTMPAKNTVGWGGGENSHCAVYDKHLYTLVDHDV